MFEEYIKKFTEIGSSRKTIFQNLKFKEQDFLDLSFLLHFFLKNSFRSEIRIRFRNFFYIHVCWPILWKKEIFSLLADTYIFWDEIANFAKLRLKMLFNILVRKLHIPIQKSINGLEFQKWSKSPFLNVLYYTCYSKCCYSLDDRIGYSWFRLFTDVSRSNSIIYFFINKISHSVASFEVKWIIKAIEL